MSRHTTGFTTDPVYRARQEIRNRLQRLQEEAKTTAKTVNAFGGNDVDQAMWEMVDQMAGSMVESLNTANEIERQNKTQAASATRMANAVGYDLADYKKESEPA